ncbi:MAG: hypothetical protein KDJ88_03440 [Bauldia sp.]|nr:hypothetical protein [Bauldia sp.]
MKWWLSVFFLINGTWVPGSNIDQPGWGPRAYQTEAECLERKAFAEKQCHNYPLDYRAEWRCSSPDPLTKVPDDLVGVEC